MPAKKASRKTSKARSTTNKTRSTTKISSTASKTQSSTKISSTANTALSQPKTKSASYKENTRIFTGYRKRGWLLTGWLTLVIIFNTFVIYALLSKIIHAASLQDPSFQYWPLIVGVFIEALNIAGAIGIFNWKKWGFYMFVIAAGCSIVSNLSLGRTFAQAALFAVVPIAILSAMIFTKNRWQMFT